jgi:hypothetical protein
MSTILLMGAGKGTISGGAAYVGPGDIIGGSLAWWGLRGYTAAYALPGNNPAIDVVKTSDGSSLTTIKILSNGSLDIATVISLGFAVSVTKIYDQSGNGNHLAQSTLSQMPALALNVIGSLPSMQFAAGSSQYLFTDSVAYNQAQPFTSSAVAQRTAVFTSLATYLGAGNFLNQFSSTANEIDFINGFDFIRGSAADSAFHAVQSNCRTSTDSTIYIDGSLTSPGITAGTNSLINNGFMGANRGGGGTQFITGYVSEGGFWGGDQGASNSAMNTNQHAYWGF